jgi:WD40 repeat protein
MRGLVVAQIWSMQSALLLVSCRGHEGEVTDLALSRDGALVASSCTDTTIRCWSLEVRAPGDVWHRECPLPSCCPGQQSASSCRIECLL